MLPAPTGAQLLHINVPLAPFAIANDWGHGIIAALALPTTAL